MDDVEFWGIAIALLTAVAGTAVAADVPLPDKTLVAKTKRSWIAKSSLSLLPGDPRGEDSLLTVYGSARLYVPHNTNGLEGVSSEMTDVVPITLDTHT